jgi:hypothetical protein
VTVSVELRDVEAWHRFVKRPAPQHTAGNDHG